jgi:hypothetical protein
VEPGARTHYEVMIEAPLSEPLLAELIAAEVAETTTGLILELPDESALFGVLNRIESLGLQLISIHRIDRRNHDH